MQSFTVGALLSVLFSGQLSVATIIFPIYPREGRCLLPCHVEDSLCSDANPRVSWYFRDDNYNFQPLSDSEFWKNEYSTHHCRQIGPFPNFGSYEGPSHYDCPRSSDPAASHYNCSLYLEGHCHYGVYKCIASINVNDTEKIVHNEWSYVQAPPDALFKPPIPLCFQPKLSNITATLHNSDDSSRVEVKWAASARPQNGSDCKLSYCRGSRKYYTRMLVYNSAHCEGTPDVVTPWYRRKRMTLHSFTGPLVSPEKYYRFQVNNTRPAHMQTLPFTDDNTQLLTSRCFYFRKQERARIIEPTANIVYDVSLGETVPIVCSAVGTPPPNVTLIHDQDGMPVVIQKSMSTVQLDFIAYDSQRFSCEASNCVLNDEGLPEQVQVKVNIIINLISDKNAYGDWY